jgi:ankyrin repeat protein
LSSFQYLIQNYTNIEKKDKKNSFKLSSNYYKSTPLIKASEKGHLDIVEYLVSKGANIEAKDKYIFYHSSLWKYFVDICFIQWSS